MYNAYFMIAIGEDFPIARLQDMILKSRYVIRHPTNQNKFVFCWDDDDTKEMMQKFRQNPDARLRWGTGAIHLSLREIYVAQEVIRDVMDTMRPIIAYILEYTQCNVSDEEGNILEGTLQKSLLSILTD